MQILLEKGRGGGSRFGKLKAVPDLCRSHPETDVCLDACHVWPAGYGIVNRLDNMPDGFDALAGIRRFRVIRQPDVFCGRKRPV